MVGALTRQHVPDAGLASAALESQAWPRRGRTTRRAGGDRGGQSGNLPASIYFSQVRNGWGPRLRQVGHAPCAPCAPLWDRPPESFRTPDGLVLVKHEGGARAAGPRPYALRSLPSPQHSHESARVGGEGRHKYRLCGSGRSTTSPQCDSRGMNDHAFIRLRPEQRRSGAGECLELVHLLHVAEGDEDRTRQ